MKNFKFTISGNTYEVDIKGFEGNLANIEVNGTLYTVELHREVRTTKTPTLIRAHVPASDKDKIEKREKGAGGEGSHGQQLWVIGQPGSFNSCC